MKDGLVVRRFLKHVYHRIGYQRKTINMAIRLCNRILSDTEKVSSNSLFLMSLTALWIACKVNETREVSAGAAALLSALSAGRVSLAALEASELDLLRRARFRVLG